MRAYIFSAIFFLSTLPLSKSFPMEAHPFDERINAYQSLLNQIEVDLERWESFRQNTEYEYESSFNFIQRNSYLLQFATVVSASALVSNGVVIGCLGAVVASLHGSNSGLQPAILGIIGVGSGLAGLPFMAISYSIGKSSKSIETLASPIYLPMLQLDPTDVLSEPSPIDKYNKVISYADAYRREPSELIGSMRGLTRGQRNQIDRILEYAKIKDKIRFANDLKRTIYESFFVLRFVSTCPKPTNSEEPRF